MEVDHWQVPKLYTAARKPGTMTTDQQNGNNMQNNSGPVTIYSCGKQQAIKCEECNCRYSHYISSYQEHTNTNYTLWAYHVWGDVKYQGFVVASFRATSITSLGIPLLRWARHSFNLWNERYPSAPLPCSWSADMRDVFLLGFPFLVSVSSKGCVLENQYDVKFWGMAMPIGVR